MGERSNEKGKELEHAVYFIQRTVLETDPKLRGAEFTVEHNKTFVTEGVPHQIDVLVRVHPSKDYESLLIFECKNWKDPVGKNEVIILSEKIDALSGSRGFLVAETFTEGAEAQVKKDPRVKLVKCSANFESPFDIVGVLHTFTELLDLNVSARIVDKKGQPVDGAFDLDEIWSFSGNPTPMRAFLKDEADRIYSETFIRERARLGLEGAHNGMAPGRIEFDQGELVCGDRQVEWFELRCNYRVTIKSLPLRSKFAMHGYGRTYSFESISQEGKSLRITIADSKT